MGAFAEGAGLLLPFISNTELTSSLQRYLQTPGQRRMRSLADINYVQDSILEGLHKASESKMHQEVARLKEQGDVSSL